MLRWQLSLQRLFQLLICPPRLLPHLPAGPRQPCAPGATLELQLQPSTQTLAPAEALDSSQQEALRGCVGLKVSCDPSSCSACAAAGAPMPPCLFTRYSLELGSAAGASLFQVGQHCRQSFLAVHHEQLAQQQRCTVVVQLDSMAADRKLQVTASWQCEQQQPQGQEQQAPKLLEEQEPELGQQELGQEQAGGRYVVLSCFHRCKASRRALLLRS